MKYLKLFESDDIRADKAKSIVPIYKSLRKYLDDLIDKMELHKVTMKASLSDWENYSESFASEESMNFPDNFNIPALLGTMDDDELTDNSLSIDDLCIFFDLKVIYRPSTSTDRPEKITHRLKKKIIANEEFLKFCDTIESKGFRIMQLQDDNFLKIFVGYGLKEYFDEVTNIFKKL